MLIEAIPGGRRSAGEVCVDRRVLLSAQKESALRVIPWRSELPSPVRKRCGIALRSEQKAEVAGGML